MPFVNVDSKLSNRRVCKGELSQGVSSNCELADAHNPDSELGQGKDSAGELANGDDTSCRHRDTVWTKLEGDVKQR